MLAIIIVSWNVRAYLQRCLTSLQTELERTGIEATTWVVDNDSTDGSADLVRGHYPWVILKETHANLGYVQGNNVALKHLLNHEMPQLVWLLNPDTEIHPGALQTLCQYFTENPRAGLVGPKLLNPDGSLQQGAFHFPGLLAPLFELGWLPLRFYNTALNGRYSPDQYAGTSPFRIDHPLGAAMMARGAAITEVGPLDEQFFMYCEEIDWAWRMHKAGWESWLVPTAHITHYGGASTNQAKPQTLTYLWESRARLYHKHHSPIVYKLVSWIVQRTFSQREAKTPEWATAHQKIIQTWRAL